MAEDNNLFKRLTRLFRSGPVVKRRVKQLKPSTSSSAFELFRKTQNSVYSTAMSAYGTYDRLARYADFSEMEYTPELSSALDIYSEETASMDENGNVLDIHSNNQRIQTILNELFLDTLNIDFNLTAWVRNLCKYGDFFLFNDVSPDQGVINAYPIPVSEMEREEGFDKDDPMAVRFRWVTQGNQVLENWQVSHFRLLGNDAFLPYGSSVLEAARRIWRQLILVEDAMLVYRVIRSPERRVFYIDVGNVPPEDIPNYMEQVQSTLKKAQVVDKNTGRVDLRYNPLSVDEDYFLPVRGGESGTRIDTLAGGSNATAIEDVEYIQKKLFSALKIPKAYLGYDEGLGSKATLSQEDIRFSRTIARIQRTIISELNKIAIIHLYCMGFEGDDLVDFTLRLPNPSTIAQQQKLELFRTRFDLAGSSPEGFVDRDWLRKNIFNLNEKDIQRIERGRKKDRLRDMEVEAVQLPESKDPASESPGGMDMGPPGGGGLPDLGGGGLPDLGGGEEPGLPEPETDTGGELDTGGEPELASIKRVGNIIGDDIVTLGSIMDDSVPIRVQNNVDKILKGLRVPKLLNEKNKKKKTSIEKKEIAKKRNANRRKKKGKDTGLPDLSRYVGTDKNNPRDSISHPYGSRSELTGKNLMSESDIDIDRIIEKWEKEIQETNDASNEIKTKLKNNKSRIDNND